MPHRRDAALFVILLVVILAVLASLTWMNYQFSTQSPGGNDFLARWMGAKMWLQDGTSPYSDDVSLATQMMIYGHPADVSVGEDINHFVYPLFSMIFFAPFGLMDYTWARALWMTLLEVCLVLTAVFSLQLSGWKLRPGGQAAVILFAILWYCGIRTLILGQFAGVEAVLILAAILCIQKNRDLEGGLLLAVSLAKPQMSFLIYIFTLVWAIRFRRNRLVSGLLFGTFFLIAGSMIFLPDWPLQWVRQMLEYPDYTGRIGSVVSIIAGAFPGISRPLSYVLYAAFLIYMVTEWAAAFKGSSGTYFWSAMLTLVITNLVAPRTATPHFILLLPAFFMAFNIWQEKWGWRGLAAAWFTLAMVLIGLWLQFIATVDGNIESAAMYLPVPFLALIFLWWSRGWSAKPATLPFEKMQM